MAPPIDSDDDTEMQEITTREEQTNTAVPRSSRPEQTVIDKPASTSAETRATGPNRFTAPVGTNLPDLAVEARERASHHRIVFELTASINAAEFFEKENELEVVAFLRQRFPSLVRINASVTVSPPSTQSKSAATQNTMATPLQGLDVPLPNADAIQNQPVAPVPTGPQRIKITKEGSDEVHRAALRYFQTANNPKTIQGLRRKVHDWILEQELLSPSTILHYEQKQTQKPSSRGLLGMVEDSINVFIKKGLLDAVNHTLTDAGVAEVNNPQIWSGIVVEL